MSEATYTVVDIVGHGPYFTGTLDAGMAEAVADRVVREGVNAHGGYTVELADGADVEASLAEFGTSSVGDREEAWRFALGSFYGMPDSKLTVIDPKRVTIAPEGTP